MNKESASPQTEVKDASPETPADPAGTKEEAVEKPTPKVFALMRNAHEVIRGGTEDISDELRKGKDADVDNVVQMWTDFHKFEVMHKYMEEGNGDKKTPMGMFA